jgi:hypothetical protein
MMRREGEIRREMVEDFAYREWKWEVRVRN